MNVLLLNMPVVFNSWQNLEMPLGVMYIAAQLEREGYRVNIKDYEVERFEKSEFEKLISRFKPDVIGVSFRSSSYASAKKICSLIKKMNPDIKIVLGGQHASAFSQDTLKDILADFVVRGEGEYIMAELLEALSLRKNFSGVAGITYRHNGEIIENISRDNIDNLDGLDFPAWHLVPVEKYVTGSILTSRGCPFSCIYCDKGISTRKVRFRSPENIYNEIIAFEKKYKKGRIYFVDDYFFLNKERLRQIFAFVLGNGGLKIRWVCQARVDGVNDVNFLRLAKKAGCDMIIYGVETGDIQELEYINKKATLEDAGCAIKITKDAGIKTRVNFMIGFPISTIKMVGNSIRFAKKLNANLYRFFIVSPLPNTILWDRVEKIYPDISRVGWDKFDFYSASFDTAEISKGDLVKYVLAAYIYVLKNRTMRELSIELVFRLAKLLYLSIRVGKMRGNFSNAFPACVNLFLEGWQVSRHIERGKKLSYLKEAFAIAKRFKKC
ncbi:MAG: radical SAM protein [Candidatus Omnitrophota bacterium]